MESVARFVEWFGARAGGCMLNVLRLTQHSENTLKARFWRYGALAAGFLFGLGGLIWQDNWAALQLPQLQQDQLKWEALMRQAQPTQAELEALQQSLAQATQRVQALETRQSMRQDLGQVQSLLFAKKPIQNQSDILTHKLHWQGGRFEWEGSSLTPAALEALLFQVGRFEGWQVQPQLIQLQDDSAQPVSALKPSAQSMVFKLQGQIEAASFSPYALAKQP